MPRTLTIANANNTRPKLAMFKPPSFAAVRNSLQLKILQRGGAIGDAQIGWPSRLPLRPDRHHVEKRWSPSRTSNSAGRKARKTPRRPENFHAQALDRRLVSTPP